MTLSENHIIATNISSSSHAEQTVMDYCAAIVDAAPALGLTTLTELFSSTKDVDSLLQQKWQSRVHAPADQRPRESGLCVKLLFGRDTPNPELPWELRRVREAASPRASTTKVCHDTRRWPFGYDA